MVLYPDIMNHETDAKELLYNLSNSYLYKDLLNLEVFGAQPVVQAAYCLGTAGYK